MGEFSSGRWIVGLLIYFGVMFLIVYCAKAGFPDNTSATSIRVTDPGYGSTSNAINTNLNGVNASSGQQLTTAEPGIGNVRATLSTITGFGSSSVNVGVPSAWLWVFSFFFFYIEFFMLLWALYMALPIIH